MTKQMYRGHEVVANDNGQAKIVSHDAVYRGVHHDPSVKPVAANENRKSRLTYRGATAA